MHNIDIGKGVIIIHKFLTIKLKREGAEILSICLNGLLIDTYHKACLSIWSIIRRWFLLIINNKVIYITMTANSKQCQAEG